MEVARVGIKKRRTRGETEASSGRTVKRNKRGNDGELTLSPTLIHLRSSGAGHVVTSSENSTSPCLDDPLTVSDYCYVPRTSDHLAVTTSSCCSSNSSSELDNDSLQNLDLQLKSTDDEIVHTSEFNCRESRELELVESVSCFVSASQPLDAAIKIPSESELEEFFSAAEKNIQEQFMEKYNYDIAKDAPLEGRYEWIQMTP